MSMKSKWYTQQKFNIDTPNDSRVERRYIFQTIIFQAISFGIYSWNFGVVDIMCLSTCTDGQWRPDSHWGKLVNRQSLQFRQQPSEQDSFQANWAIASDNSPIPSSAQEKIDSRTPRMQRSRAVSTAMKFLNFNSFTDFSASFTGWLCQATLWRWAMKFVSINANCFTQECSKDNCKFYTLPETSKLGFCQVGYTPTPKICLKLLILLMEEILLTSW